MNNLTKVSRRRFLATTGTGIFGLSTFGCYKSKPHLEDNDRPTLHRPTGMDDAAWADVRAQFILDPSIIYMNNAHLERQVRTSPNIRPHPNPTVVVDQRPVFDN